MIALGEREWPRRRTKTSPQKEDAIQCACSSLGSEHFHDPIITAGNSLLIHKPDLRRECQRRRDRADALKVVADYVRTHSSIFVRDAARLMTPEQTAKQKARIEAVATEIEALADPAKQGEVTYNQFESLLGELHKLGFFPETSAVAAVARAFV
jgi:hypothetical protein